jgi:hypothetical protein
MKNLTISKKLFIGFSLILSTVILLIIVNRISINSISDKYDGLLKHETAIIEKVNIMRLDFFKIRKIENLLMYEQDNSMVKDAKVIADKISSESSSTKAIINNINEDNISKLANESIELFSTYQSKFIAMTEAQAGNDRMMAAVAVRKIAKNFEDKLDTFNSVIKEKLSQQNEAITNEIKKIFLFSIALGVLAIAIGIATGILLKRNIVSSANSIQQGLNSFFSFLNRETNKAELIKLDSKDEFGQMAAAINSNISAIEKGLIADANAVANSVEVANKIKAGYLNEQITVIPNNPQLVELRNVLNEMLQTLSNKVSYDLNELELVFKAYIASDFTARIKNPKGQVDIITNNLGDEISTMLSNSLQNGIDCQRRS